MSYGVSLESMLIPDAGSYYPDDLAALENWIIDMESAMIAEDVAYYAAMEAEGADAGEAGAAPSSFITRIRTAFNNLRAGKKKGDSAAVAEATKEIQQASDEFNEEASKESDPDKKKKWKKAAAIIAAIVAAVGIAVGAVALSKRAKGKAESGSVTPNEVKSMVSEGVKAIQSADPKQIADPGDKPALPAHEGPKALAGPERLALPAPAPTKGGTGASVKKADGTTEKLLSRNEQKAANRTAQYSTPNPAGNRATRRGSTFQQETSAQKKARLLREAAHQTAASGGTVSKEQARRVQNAEKQVQRQETVNAHKIIAETNALRGEMKKGGAPASDNVTPAENRGEIQDLLSQVQGHFSRMKQGGGLQVKTSGSGSTFYKRTKQGDQAKVFKKEIDGMAQAIARLTQLGYNGDAIDMYNQLKKAQK